VCPDATQIKQHYMQNIITLYILFFSTLISAHNFKGIVKTKNEGAPIEGVSVYNKSTGAYTYTNSIGYFELGNVTLGDTILFYQLGYKNLSLVINAQNVKGTQAISLEVARAALDQIFITTKTNVQSQIAAVDLETNPVRTSQDILKRFRYRSRYRYNHKCRWYTCKYGIACTWTRLCRFAFYYT
jgi:hypothetical protein